MSQQDQVSLVLGRALLDHSVLFPQGVILVRIADVVLRLRVRGRAHLYIEPGARYAIAYKSDGFADTISVLVKNPSIQKFQQLQERAEKGNLPTREVWKKVPNWKKKRKIILK